jgi:hypothetical protein
MKLNQSGSLILEVLLSTFILTVLSGLILFGLASLTNDDIHTQKYADAESVLDESFIAIRSIRDSTGLASVSSQAGGPRGLSFNSATSVWSIAAAPDTGSGLNRTINITNPATGVSDVNININWTSSTGRTGNLTRTERVTDWRTSTISQKGGLLVFGSGNNANDALSYKLLSTSGTWGAATPGPDVDTGSTNKIPLGMKVYSSSTRNEKILVSRHQAGAVMYIYAAVWNGNTATWGAPKLLSTYNVNLTTEPYDGTYLSNGDFTTVYSGGNNIPRMQVWNGTSWLATEVSLPLLTGGAASIPIQIITRNRPATNEIMFATVTSNTRTITAYFNGGTYTAINWTSLTSQSTANPAAGVEMADFNWSSTSPLVGLLVYSTTATDRSINHKIWNANGTGGGVWTGTVNGPNQPAGSTVGNYKITSGLSGQFMSCDKASGTGANTGIFCIRSTLVPAVSTPAGSPIVASTTTSNQQTYDMANEYQSSNEALAFFSQGTTSVGSRLYNDTTNSWASTASTIPVLPAASTSVQAFSDLFSKDIMVLMDNGSSNISTIFWDGTNNVFYGSPDKGLLLQSNTGNGSANVRAGFAWDRL